MTSMKKQCKLCKRFFEKSDMDWDSNYECIEEYGICYKCFDAREKRNSTDERIKKYGDKDAMNLSTHKHDYGSA